VIEAARVKAGHRMAYADAFAVATALAHGADLLTAIRQSCRETSLGPLWTFVAHNHPSFETLL